MKYLLGLLAGAGALGILTYWTLFIGLLVGWVINIFKLVTHLPLLDMELVVRLLGLIFPIGGIVGWINF